MTGSGEQYARWVAAGRLNGISLFADATLLGAPSGLANLAQAAAIALGAAGVFWVFRTTARRELRLAAMLAGVLLAAPHASQQDGVLLGLAAAAFLAVALEDGLRVRDAAAVAALWITPLLNPPSLFRIGLVTPVILVAFLACVALKARQRAAAYVPADGAQANETRTGTRIGQADRSIA
jgi:hypothetical protein